MNLLGKLRRSRTGGTARLREWVVEHRGVEAFVEPRTTVTETTLLLVAHDGGWTRGRIGSPEAARKFARSLKIPIYDVQLVGYPQRMRDHDARQRLLRKRALEQELRPPEE